jgi:serine protease Do
MKARSWFAGGVLVLVLTAAPLLAQPRESYLKSSPQLLAALGDVVAKTRLATVRVRCSDKDAVLGTVVGSDGWIVTKFSELKGDPLCALSDGRELKAKVIGVQTQYDLALLKVDAKDLPVVAWRESKEDGVGSWVASPGLEKVSDSNSFRNTISVGVISVASRSIDARSIPRVRPNPKGGYLGVMMAPVEGGGIKITEVREKTPAAKAGLKVDDIVKVFDGHTITDMDSMHEVLGKRKPGDKVTIKIERQGEAMELTAELGKRPADLDFNRGDMQNSMGSVLSERRAGFPTILQHDTVLKPTDCGGPLVDLDGKVVGINIARAGRTESYAIPSETVQTMLADLKAGKYPPPKPDTTRINADRLKQVEESIRKLKEQKSDLDKRLKEAEDELRKLKDPAAPEKKPEDSKPDGKN